MSARRPKLAAQTSLSWCLVVAVIGGCWWGMLVTAEEPVQAPPVQTKPPKFNAEELRKKYPYVSIAPRLEYERKRVEADADHAAPKLSAEAEANLKTADARFASNGTRSFHAIRTESLRLLHSDQVDKFVAREGFGLSRMPSPSPYQLELPAPQPIPFVKVKTESAEFAESLAVTLPKTEPKGGPKSPLRMPPVDVLSSYFHQNEMYFASIASLGHVKDREHVAGFQPHAFYYSQPWVYPIQRGPTPADPDEDKQPKPDQWAIAGLELVSLLKHEKPVAYVSENLPRMEELREAKTRPLSDFEARSLKALRAGEDLVTSATANRIAMLGAVRASKACLECHYVKHGELLGAFSYDLRRDPPITAPPQAEPPVR